MSSKSVTVWAIVNKGGAVRLCKTNGARPEVAGHRKQCRTASAVFRLEREPRVALGEGVNTKTGAIDFDVNRVLPVLANELRAIAAARIEAVAPIWRQINDLAEPGAPGEASRRRAINAARSWSNEIEAAIGACTSADDVAALMQAARKKKWENAR